MAVAFRPLSVWAADNADHFESALNKIILDALRHDETNVKEEPEMFHLTNEPTVKEIIPGLETVKGENLKTKVREVLRSANLSPSPYSAFQNLLTDHQKQFMANTAGWAVTTTLGGGTER